MSETKTVRPEEQYYQLLKEVTCIVSFNLKGKDKAFSGDAKILYCMMLQRFNFFKGNYYDNIEDLALLCGSNDSTVKRNINLLTEVGLVVKTSVKTSKGRTNKYTVRSLKYCVCDFKTNWQTIKSRVKKVVKEKEQEVDVIEPEDVELTLCGSCGDDFNYCDCSIPF